MAEQNAPTPVQPACQMTSSISTQLGYLCGALAGDGCISASDKGRISFSVSDIDFAQAAANAVKSVFGLNAHLNKRALSKKNPAWRDAYGFCSRPLYRFMNLNDASMQKFLMIGDIDTRKAFIRGFFDAEGNVDIHMVRRKREVQRRVRCFNNNRILLEAISGVLEIIGIDSKIFRNKGRTHCLVIWNRRSLIIFEREIGFTIERKQRLLRKAIASYRCIQSRVSKETREDILHLRSFGYGASKIQKELLETGINVPKPSIEYWLYATRRGANDRNSKTNN
jgi:intein-encoded DNA endonuclease-like protein